MQAQDSPVRVPLHGADGSVRATALLDPQDAYLTRHRWSLSTSGYAFRTDAHGVGIYLHRAVLGLTRGDGQIADHINRDRMDNRRSNLRVVTSSENARNRVTGRRKSAASAYPGVSWHKPTGKWQASWRRVHLGLYVDEADAARAVSRATQEAAS